MAILDVLGLMFWSMIGLRVLQEKYLFYSSGPLYVFCFMTLAMLLHVVTHF